MDFNEYQNRAGETAVYPGKGTVLGLAYCTLGFAGEAGETANKVKKIFRDCNGQLTPDIKIALIKEIGGALWYASQMATELDLLFDNIPRINLEELAGRKERGTIHGNGDNR